ncbi:MAG: PKD domain-containing protein, partial [Phycisphaerae bacterium]
VSPGDVTAAGVLSGIVLLPPGAHESGLFAISPAFYPIHNEDGLGDPDFLDRNLPRVPTPSGQTGFVGRPQINWNLFFHDLVVCSDCESRFAREDGAVVSDFAVAYAAHEYLHSWEGYPDLYDYDVFDQPGPVINCPIGIWDIMANGGLVHPAPILKAKECTNWTEPVDLTSVVTPGVDTVLTLPPAEFVRDESYFFLENPKRPGERYYLWSAGHADSFDASYPGAGMLIQHTDIDPDNLLGGAASNPDAIAQQQRSAVRPSFLMVQADGLNELQACNTGGNQGDAGDIWPGSTNATRFNFDTTPAANWYASASWTGLDIRNVVPDSLGAVQVTVNWVPTSIPSLRFTAPPEGQSVAGNFNVEFQTTDVFGGTDVSLYFTEDKKTCGGMSGGTACNEHADCPATSDLDLRLCRHDTQTRRTSNRIGKLRKTTPGTRRLSMNWNLRSTTAPVPNGRYVLFADLAPGAGADGTEDAFTTPLPGRSNQGAGSVMVMPCSSSGCNPPRFETWTLECVDAAAGTWRVNGTLTQPVLNEADPDSDPWPRAVTGQLYTSIGGEVSFTINETQPFAVGDTFQFTTTGVTAVSAGLAVSNGEISESPVAVIKASPLTGDPPLTVSFDGRDSFDPNGERLDFVWDFGDGTPTVSSPTAMHEFTTAGTFGVSLTVTRPANPPSRPIPLSGEARVDIRVTNNSPTVVLAAPSPASGLAPLNVLFDASASSDTETRDINKLIFQWDFGDGRTGNSQGLPGTLIETSHTYSRREDGTLCTKEQPCSFRVVLTVTDENGGQGQATTTVLVGNTTPVARVTASPLTGPAPLEVLFNASGSLDADAGDELTVKWQWGDGTPDETTPIAGTDGTGTVSHTYAAPGTYTPVITVSDRGFAGGLTTGFQDVFADLTIEVTGNRPPEAVVFVSPERGVAGETEFRFDASRSTDPDEGPLTYLWEFGDDETSDKAIAFHKYNRPSPDPEGFPVKLTVTDNRGAMDTQTVRVPVVSPPENQPPQGRIATHAPSCTVPCRLTLNAIFGDPNGDPLSFEWTIQRQGQALVESLTGPVIVFEKIAGNDIGTYDIRLTVSDGQEGGDQSAETTIVVLQPGAAPPPGTPGPIEPSPESPIRDSALQRPTPVCGLGMIFGLFGSFMGLTLLRAGRRRLRPR